MDGMLGGASEYRLVSWGEMGPPRRGSQVPAGAQSIEAEELGHCARSYWDMWIEETDVESVSLDTGRAGHHAWHTSKPATSLRGGPGGASRKIGRNESKVGLPAKG